MRTAGCMVVLFVLSGGAASLHAAAPEPQVVAQDLQQMRVPGKVSAVVWTRRDESYTLQLVLQMTTEFQLASKIAQQRAAQGLSPAPPAAPKLPQVQAWLLKADGTTIARSPGSPAFPVAIRANDGVPLEVKYSFSRPEGQAAVAVAIMVDGAYYIQPLSTFGKEGG